MSRIDNVIDFAHYRSRHQARRLGEMMWAVHAWWTGYTVLQPPARHDGHGRRA